MEVGTSAGGDFAAGHPGGEMMGGGGADAFSLDALAAAAGQREAALQPIGDAEWERVGQLGMSMLSSADAALQQGKSLFSMDFVQSFFMRCSFVASVLRCARMALGEGSSASHFWAPVVHHVRLKCTRCVRNVHRASCTRFLRTRVGHSEASLYHRFGNVTAYKLFGLTSPQSPQKDTGHGFK